MINPNKPLGLKDYDNKVTLVGLMPNGDIVVSINDSSVPAIFDSKTNRGKLDWCDYILENKPEVTSAFYWWDTFSPSIRGQGLILLTFVWTEYPEAKFCLEIISTDGIPTDAKIHERPKS